MFLAVELKNATPLARMCLVCFSVVLLFFFLFVFFCLLFFFCFFCCSLFPWLLLPWQPMPVLFRQKRRFQKKRLEKSMLMSPCGMASAASISLRQTLHSIRAKNWSRRSCSATADAKLCISVSLIRQAFR